MTDETQPAIKLGRPSSYTQEIADEICERLADGEGLRAICREANMPNKSTVFRWLPLHDVFRDQYARARETQADGFVDEIIEIADNEPDPQKARVRVDVRKWVAGKMRPKVYGERLTQVHTDPDGKPINTAPTIIFTGSPSGASAPETVASPTDESN